MSDGRKTILLVDDNMANLTRGKELLKDRYKVLPLPSAETMFHIIDNVTPDLILLDVEMPEMDGYTALKRLKASLKWADIPVVFLTAKSDEKSEMEGLSLGAVDYVAKPFSAPLLLKRIENLLRMEEQKAKLKSTNESLLSGMLKKSEEVLSLQNAIVSAVANLVEFRDDVTGGHITRTQKYLELLLEEVIRSDIYPDETRKWDLDFALPSAQLHDVGKIAISDAILNKPGRLSPEEFEIIKTHVTTGVEALKRISKNMKEHQFLRHAMLFAGSHHEKWDGTGYPNGLIGTDIPLEGRLLAIADVYDALISKRPYKSPISTADANQVIINGSGTHFDPVLVGAFQRVKDDFAHVTRLGLL